MADKSTRSVPLTVRAMEGLGDARRRWRDVEVQNIFAHSQFGVQRYCRLVSPICLNKYHIRATLSGDLTEPGDECRGHTLSAMLLVHREIVDVDLRSSLFEFR